MFLGHILVFHSVNQGARMSPEICSQGCIKKRMRTANKSAWAMKDDVSNSQKGGLQLCNSWKKCLDSEGTMSTAQKRGLSLIKMPDTKMSY